MIERHQTDVGRFVYRCFDDTAANLRSNAPVWAKEKLHHWSEDLVGVLSQSPLGCFRVWWRLPHSQPFFSFQPESERLHDLLKAGWGSEVVITPPKKGRKRPASEVRPLRVDLNPLLVIVAQFAGVKPALC